MARLFVFLIALEEIMICKTCRSQFSGDNCSMRALTCLQSATNLRRPKHTPGFGGGTMTFRSEVWNPNAPTAAALSGNMFWDTKASSFQLIWTSPQGVGSGLPVGGHTAYPYDTYRAVQMFTKSVHDMADDSSAIHEQLVMGRLVPTAFRSGTP